MSSVLSSSKLMRPIVSAGLYQSYLPFDMILRWHGPVDMTIDELLCWMTLMTRLEK
jgi:hypothetical protein